MKEQLSRFFRNPLLVRELRQRMRRARAVLIVTIYLSALVGTLWLIAVTAFQRQPNVHCVGEDCFPVPQENLLFIGSAGRSLQHILLFVILMLVCAIVPGLTAGAISGERDRQTLAPMIVTLMRPITILVGKLSASLAFILLLVVATLPILSVAFWIGGASPADAIKGVAMVVVTAIVLASLGLLASTFIRRTGPATIISYGMMFLLTVGTFAVFGASAFWSNLRGEPSQPNRALLVPNPFVATASVLGGEAGVPEAMGSPFSAMQQILRTESFVADPVPINEGPGADIDVGREFRRRIAWDPIPFWVVSLLAFAAITGGSLRLASARLKAPTPNMR